MNWPVDGFSVLVILPERTSPIDTSEYITDFGRFEAVSRQVFVIDLLVYNIQLTCSMRQKLRTFISGSMKTTNGPINHEEDNRIAYFSICTTNKVATSTQRFYYTQFIMIRGLIKISPRKFNSHLKVTCLIVFDSRATLCLFLNQKPGYRFKFACDT